MPLFLINRPHILNYMINTELYPLHIVEYNFLYLGCNISGIQARTDCRCKDHRVRIFPNNCTSKWLHRQRLLDRFGSARGSIDGCRKKIETSKRWYKVHEMMKCKIYSICLMTPVLATLSKWNSFCCKTWFKMKWHPHWFSFAIIELPHLSCYFAYQW